MGKLKWDVNYIHGRLDQLELVIKKMEPIIEEVEVKAKKLRSTKNLPQYVTQRVNNLLFTNNATADRFLAGVRSIRSTLPDIERNHRHKTPRLVKGYRYQVMLGGAFLTAPKLLYPEAPAYMTSEESRNLYRGDIITYLGNYILEGSRPNAKPADIFSIGDFEGKFQPSIEGKANRHYLAKAK